MKARLLAVLLVSSLVLASAANVALAQATAGKGQATAGEATAGDDRDNDRADVTIVDCSQVQNAFGSQGQYGNASAQYLSEAIAVVSQELNISQNQVNECLGGQKDDGNRDGDNEDGDNEGEGTGTSDTEGNDLEDGEKNVLAGTDPGGTLPKTGGPSLLALGAGVALVAGGASLIRFRR